MSEKAKFLFDTSFEGPLPAVGQTAPPPPPPEPEESEPSITEEDLAQAREAGRQEGIEIGREEGRGEALGGIEQATQNLLVGLTGHMVDLLGAQPQMREEVAGEALKTATQILTKLVPSLEKAAAMKEIEAVVSECLERAKEEPRLVVRVSERMLNPVKSRIEPLAASEGFEGKIVLIAADGFCESDVRVEWADGGAERNLENIWQDIDQVLARYLKVPAESLRHATAALGFAASAAVEPQAPTEPSHDVDSQAQEAPPLVSPVAQMGLSESPDAAANNAATENCNFVAPEAQPVTTADEPTQIQAQPDAEAAGLQEPPQELKHD